MILKIFSLTSRRTLKRNLNLPRLHPLLRGADGRRDQSAEAGHGAGDEADPGVDIGVGADTGGVGVEVNPTRDDTEVTAEREIAPGGAERGVLRDTARVTMMTTMMITLDTGGQRTGGLADTDRCLWEKFQNHV